LAELRKCLKLPNIRKELSNLPKTLDATYTRILKNIPSMYQREMRTVLMLLAFSERPMTIQEVSEATAVNLEEQKFSIEDRFPDAYDLLEFCSSLVSLSELSNDPEFQIRREGIYRYGQMPPDVRILQFAHFSVKEYILSDRTQKTIPPYLLINEALSHSYITQACLIYLLDFNNGERASRFDHEEFPFLAYAALYWTTHLSSMTEIERGSMEALLVRLFDPQNENNLMNYLNLYDPNRRSFGDDRKELSLGTLSLNKRDFQPPLYYACYHGLQPIVKYLLSGDEKTRPSKEVMGSGLAAAASAGYVDTVKLLLKEGADPNSPYCGRFWRPLHAAASSGNPTVVKLLLEAGSLINAHNGDDGGALHIAAEQGNPEVIQLLIDHGHDLYTWSRYHGPPLSYAVMRNRDEAVAALVQNKVDVNTPPDGYFNSLNLASEHASIETIRLILDNGANAALERSGSQALHNAAKRGDIDIMQLLIERGADVNGASNGVYGTPLKAAIQSRQQPVFEFMLRKGADINARGSTTKYPIDQALFGGNQKAAERLIELGAQFGDEALERALDYSSKEYLGKMLLDRGANPNAEHHR
jgi:ankyrin repeat protein